MYTDGKRIRAFVITNDTILPEKYKNIIIEDDYTWIEAFDYDPVDGVLYVLERDSAKNKSTLYRTSNKYGRKSVESILDIPSEGKREVVTRFIAKAAFSKGIFKKKTFFT